MSSGFIGTDTADVIASLRANPILASVSDEGLDKIAALVAQETRASVGAALREVDLFRGLSDGDLERIQAISEPVVKDVGTTLFDEGDEGDRFYVVVRGVVELTRDVGGVPEIVSVMREGQAFGELALLDEVSRPTTARVSEQSFLIGIGREPFLDTLGPEDGLAPRLLRNLARALGSQRATQTVQDPVGRQGKSPRSALTEYNRMVRSRLLPRGAPSVPGYDVAGLTATLDQGEGSALWDWFLFGDGRLALAVLKADEASLSSAQRLLAVRGLLRGFAEDPIPGLGSLLGRVNRGLRAGWVDGISGSVSCGLAVVSEDGIEWASAGACAGTVVRSEGSHEDLVPDAPALGADDDVDYHAKRLRLAPGDHLLAFSEGPSDSVIQGRRFLSAKGRYPSARDRLDALVERVAESAGGDDPDLEITAILVGRTGAEESSERFGADAVARAAAAFDSGSEREEGEIATGEG
jgi:CRP-like cAMP-binding protein